MIGPLNSIFKPSVPPFATLIYIYRHLWIQFCVFATGLIRIGEEKLASNADIHPCGKAYLKLLLVCHARCQITVSPFPLSHCTALFLVATSHTSPAKKKNQQKNHHTKDATELPLSLRDSFILFFKEEAMDHKQSYRRTWDAAILDFWVNISTKVRTKNSLLLVEFQLFTSDSEHLFQVVCGWPKQSTCPVLSSSLPHCLPGFHQLMQHHRHWRRHCHQAPISCLPCSLLMSGTSRLTPYVPLTQSALEALEEI